MSTKFLIVFFSIIAGLMGGLALNKRVSSRERYFDELVRIIDRLISDIRFSQQKLQDILKEYSSASQQMSKNLTEYIAFLNGEELNLSRGLLTKREHRLVTEFFIRLGSLDLDTQIDELIGRKESFEGFKIEAKNKNKSYGKAYVKLGFLAGLLIGILLL